MRRPRIYLAGPDVFLPRDEALRVAAGKKRICAELGLEGVFPFDLDPGIADLPPGAARAEAIARKDEHLVKSCDAVLANLTPFRSPSADVGTVYELGLASGLGKLVFGYTEEHLEYAKRVPRRADGCDENGLFVEDHGCFDNLMLHGALTSSGDRQGPQIAPADAVTGSMEASASLSTFRVAAERAAATLLPRGNGAARADLTDAGCMAMALHEAQLAVEAGNHPFGAVLVADGEVVLRGQNTVVSENDPTRHAELGLVSTASRLLPRDLIARSTLVTSTAPCPMCAGAIYWSGIQRVVYGCPAETLGEISGEELATDCRDVLSSGRLRTVEVVGPVMGEEAAAQHRAFWPAFLAGGNPVV